MLRLTDIEVVYDNAVLALSGVSLEAKEGCITALLGANGAGKSTTLKAVSGLLYWERGAITRGTIEWNGARIDGLQPHEIVRRAIVQVFEGRRVFANLTVEENLLVGGHVEPQGAKLREGLERAYAMFPRLKERRRQDAGYLSGGEQQMLAIARALICRPQAILLDEPSLGLAPMLAEEIFHTVTRLKTELGCTVLLVEQNAAAALEIADYAYVMETGRIALAGSGAEVRDSEDVARLYLGFAGGAERRDYRAPAPLRARRRWLAASA
ncbi:MAG TPA: ABC transporter ATP-binding protein [Acetobacteraceae bacterium]|nr:ABC transporter ATP-binding protein [Acetobacteraceae bacterium]